MTAPLSDAWITPRAARDIRAGLLRSIRCYLRGYRRDRMGFQKRLAANLLKLAADYRRIERNPQQRAA